MVCDGGKGYLGWWLPRCGAHRLRYGDAAAQVSEEGKTLSAELNEVHRRMTRELATSSSRARAHWLTGRGKAWTRLLRRHGRSRTEGARRAVEYLRNGRSWRLTFLLHPGWRRRTTEGSED